MTIDNNDIFDDLAPQRVEFNRSQMRLLINDLSVIISTRVQVLDALNVVNSLDDSFYIDLELEVKQFADLLERYNHG